MMKSSLADDYSPTPLHHLTFVLQQISDELLQKEVGTSLSHVRIMGALDYSAPSSQRAIAVKTHQTEANISRQLLVMARQRLVKISKNKKDARQRDVTLTAKGQRKYEEAQTILQNQLSQIYKNFTKEEKKDFENHIARATGAF
jgi:DNA-binding MarR family transcriptional regulator